MDRCGTARRIADGKSILAAASGAGYAGPLLVGARPAHCDGVDVNPDLVRCSNATCDSDNTHYQCDEIFRFDPG
jgi:hypothetical protein